MLHWSANAPDDNPPDEYIANLQDSPDGKWIKVAAEKSGDFHRDQRPHRANPRLSRSRGLAAPSPYRQPGLRRRISRPGGCSAGGCCRPGSGR